MLGVSILLEAMLSGHLVPGAVGHLEHLSCTCTEAEHSTDRVAHFTAHAE